MPTLHWIGKEKVVNHHRDVPFRVLEHQYRFEAQSLTPTLSKGEGESSPFGGVRGGCSGGAIIHGDNLEALKSLLPEYEGRVKCIYIDPPYNTGNEGWVYNDNVNDPKIRKWLHSVVGREGEDLSRHDKWLCMMYPRLMLLHKLLADDGFIAISIDDNELYNLGLILTEIFGSHKRLACIPVKSEPSGGKGKNALRIGHEYLVVYFKGNTNGLALEEKEVEGSILKDVKGVYAKGRELSKWGSESLRSDREDMWFPLYAPDGSIVFPYRNDGKEGRWRWGKNNPKIKEILSDPLEAHWEIRKFDIGVIINEESERWFPFEKIREKVKSFGWNTWLDKIGSNSEGTKQIKEIFSDKIFDTPKPLSLIEWYINLMNDKNGIILDSFAGSGTTAHAVLNLNKQDGGNRKFILIEMEDYAESITAERVRRVMNGYGEGNKTVEGTGGSFDYYTLGEPLFTEDHLLNELVGEEKIRQYVWFTETHAPMPAVSKEIQDSKYLLGLHNSMAYYFVYEAELVTTLDYDMLAQLKTSAASYLIYADNCLLPKDYLDQNNIIFKKIPRDISRF